MVSKADEAWAAGFYEGEGHLTSYVKGVAPPRVQIAQCNREPLDKLQNLFGGQIYGPERPKGSRQDVYRWVITNHQNSRHFIYTIFPYLSDKKQKDTLDKIDRYADVVSIRKAYCSKGHDKDVLGFILQKNGGRVCKTCRNERRRGK